MNADAWNLLAERSRALVHQASLLMGMLTHPAQVIDDEMRLAVAARTGVAVDELSAALAAAPELAAHLRTVQRFQHSLDAWQQSVAEDHPMARRYQTALLQQAAQVLISCLHIETLAVGECARVDAGPFEALARSSHGGT